MGRYFGNEQVDLRAALSLLRGEPLPAADYAERILECCGCSRRAAADAIRILRRADCIDRVSSDPDDKRRKSYRLTAFGERLLGHPEGGRLLRHARKLFTSCPSPRTRRNQPQLASRVPEIEFQRRSDLLLNLFRNPDGTPLSRDATRDGSAHS
jgi:hypothetical protein